ncbi:hypothetical protein [Paraburkholderia diazotrophica]|uniref:hypothetical protein n=1 Tax=Paraburkholderia diazotrophica TaxID=667676 RepID=UPI0031708181
MDKSAAQWVQSSAGLASIASSCSQSIPKVAECIPFGLSKPFHWPVLPESRRSIFCCRRHVRVIELSLCEEYFKAKQRRQPTAPAKYRIAARRPHSGHRHHARTPPKPHNVLSIGTVIRAWSVPRMPSSSATMTARS